MGNFLSALLCWLFGIMVGFSLSTLLNKTSHETTKRLEPTNIKITNLDGKVDTTYIYNLKKY